MVIDLLNAANIFINAEITYLNFQDGFDFKNGSLSMYLVQLRQLFNISVASI